MLLQARVSTTMSADAAGSLTLPIQLTSSCGMKLSCMDHLKAPDSIIKPTQMPMDHPICIVDTQFQPMVQQPSQGITRFSQSSNQIQSTDTAIIGRDLTEVVRPEQYGHQVAYETPRATPMSQFIPHQTQLYNQHGVKSSFTQSNTGKPLINLSASCSFACYSNSNPSGINTPTGYYSAETNGCFAVDNQPDRTLPQFAPGQPSDYGGYVHQASTWQQCHYSYPNGYYEPLDSSSAAEQAPLHPSGPPVFLTNQTAQGQVPEEDDGLYYESAQQTSCLDYRERIFQDCGLNSQCNRPISSLVESIQNCVSIETGFEQAHDQPIVAREQLNNSSSSNSKSCATVPDLLNSNQWSNQQYCSSDFVDEGVAVVQQHEEQHTSVKRQPSHTHPISEESANGSQLPRQELKVPKLLPIPMINKDSSTSNSVMRPTQRVNQCGICGRNYARPSTLKTHLRTHTNERPFKCNVCMKTFSQAANLTAHQRVHTGKLLPR